MSQTISTVERGSLFHRLAFLPRTIYLSVIIIALRSLQLALGGYRYDVESISFVIWTPMGSFICIVESVDTESSTNLTYILNTHYIAEISLDNILETVGKVLFHVTSCDRYKIIAISNV